MQALGRHLILELRGCDPRLLDDLPYIRQTLLEAAQIAGATIVGQTFHKFHPVGVTGVVAIAESHLCIHTWPEYGYAAVDIFTCGERFSPHRAAQWVIERLHCQEPDITELERGRLEQRAAASPS
ncbi:MAG: adenosylmethionine decarboxylase [Dehalococcoidia bacterium]|nr:adenosylmethionine decarboxylase [Dehalococcoidia bacterium]MDW8119586.1 adenosylmethionine decarboxylase [Chloroflexota bacterium]